MTQSSPTNTESAASGRNVPVSVVILTRDEEPNIEACLLSCTWCDDVHVVDSGSTDQTCQIAERLGAKVHHHPFTTFGEQRNWAIDHIEHKYEWVFHLDADERFTPELVAEIAAVIATAPPEAGFYVPHKLMFMGRWLRYAEGGYPIYQMRFFHRQRMRFRDYGHGQRESTSGRIGVLHRPYLHFNFSKGLDEWIDKHNRYSALEAREAFDATATVLSSGTPWPVAGSSRRESIRVFRARGSVDSSGCTCCGWGFSTGVPACTTACS